MNNYSEFKFPTSETIDIDVRYPNSMLYIDANYLKNKPNNCYQCHGGLFNHYFSRQLLLDNPMYHSPLNEEMKHLEKEWFQKQIKKRETFKNNIFDTLNVLSDEKIEY